MQTDNGPAAKRGLAGKPQAGGLHLASGRAKGPPKTAQQKGTAVAQ